MKLLGLRNFPLDNIVKKLEKILPLTEKMKTNTTAAG